METLVEKKVPKLIDNGNTYTTLLTIAMKDSILRLVSNMGIPLEARKPLRRMGTLAMVLPLAGLLTYS